MKKYSFLLITLATMWSCGNKDKTQTTNNETTTQIETNTTPTTVDSAAIMKPQIEQILNSYYSDLAAENIDENKYFAPVVTAFFNSQNIPIAKVGESLRQGFKTMDNRKFNLDAANTVITKTATGYEAEISGNSEHTDAKTKKQTKGDFHNKIVFDKSLKITAYTVLPKVEEGARGLGETEETETAFAEKVMNALSAANAIEQFIDTEKGVLYMYRQGVFDHIVIAKNYTSLKSANNQVDASLKRINCKSLEMKSVAFDCDKGFKEKGCFLSPVQGYHDVSERAAALNGIKGGVKKYSAQEISAEKEMETMVTHQLIITEKYLLLGLGKVNGKWRVITIDTSKFDCSA